MHESSVTRAAPRGAQLLQQMGLERQANSSALGPFAVILIIVSIASIGAPIESLVNPAIGHT
jgi:hypothetical protein